jgi:hypothetical protein
MVTFRTTLQRFEKMGEKTGWTFIEIPVDIAAQIKPGVKVSYRVKGSIDDHKIKMVAMLPMGDGAYIVPINATMRKGIRKEEGAGVEVSLEEDTDEFIISPDLVECLELDEAAAEKFSSLSSSHQKYFSNWIESAKTIETKTKRISMAVKGLAMGLDYGGMIRHFKKLNTPL